jgi:hypothetical protein
MKIKSILNPQGSVMAGLAVAGTVYAIYQLDVGSVAQAAATDANHPQLESSRKKAGYTAFIAVSGISLITRDGNVAILGYASIVAMEIHYRTAIMSSPATGKIVAPDGGAYQPAQNVVPISPQGQTA